MRDRKKVRAESKYDQMRRYRDGEIETDSTEECKMGGNQRLGRPGMEHQCSMTPPEKAMLGETNR